MTNEEMMDLLERAKTLLKATTDLLEKQEGNYYVLNLLEETVFYDGAVCRGSCLKNDIGFHRGYCGHEMIDGGWLINMNGRIYDPWLAMFLSPDNYIQDPLNSQNFNRYSYCINNPLKYTDPTGNMFEVFIAFSLFNIASNMMIA